MSPNTLGLLLPGFIGLELPDWLAARLERGLAGVCLFGSNVESPRQLRRLTDAIIARNPRALIAIDEEGGDVTRLFYDRGAPTPGNAWLGRYDDLDVTMQAGEGIARELRAVGVNLNFAPSVDVNSNDANPVIGVRSFGADPARVAAHSAAWVRGHQSMGVAACAKHFPGHGDTDLDSHLTLPTVDRALDELRQRELLPFVSVVEADVWSIMTSHILLPQLDPGGPATFSLRALRDVLRDELGFGGVVVSDALDMAGASAEIGIPAAAAKALRGGCDLLCIGTDNSAVQLDEIAGAIDDAAGDDATFADVLARAADRVAALGERLAAARSEAAQLADAFADPPAGDLPDPRAAFDVSEVARALLSRGPDDRGWTVVVLNTVPNNAAGSAPWGVEAARDETDRVNALDVDSSVTPDFIATLPADRRLVVVGRDNHRHAWVRDLVDDVRSRRNDVLVIDMGWPDASRMYADIATFGASRRLGRAVLDLLAGGISLTEAGR